MSIDPSLGGVSLPTPPAVDLTAPTSTGSGDSYSVSLRLPRHLSPHASIRVSDGHGGTQDVELIDLIRNSRTDASARANLRTLAAAAAADPSILNQCYVSKEENLLPMLAQLGSSDPVARREGSLSLRHFILSHPEDRALQQGLIATVADVAQQDRGNVEAREMLVAVSRDSSPQNAGLRQWMSNQPAVAQVTGVTNVASAQPNAANPAPNGGQAVNPLTRNLSTAGGEVIPAVASLVPGSSPVPVQPLTAARIDRLVSLVETRTQGTPLEGIPTEGILSFAQSHAALPAQQFDDLLRLRILADALPLNGFTGALFGTSSTLAGSLAEEIRRELVRGDGAADRGTDGAVLAHGLVSPDGVQPGSTLAPTGVVPAILPGAPALDPSRPGLSGGFAAAVNFFVPSLLTSLSGMQGVASQPNGVIPTPLATLAYGLGGHSSYHVGGPTALDEDSHQGFGGGSSGNGSGHPGGGDGGEHRDERREGSDAYLA